jgi:hypothetical protein
VAAPWNHRSFRLWAGFSVLWCIGLGAVAAHLWHENELSRTYMGRAECRPENQKPPAWCFSIPQKLEDFSVRPYLLLALTVPAGALLVGYAVVRMTTSRARR